MKKIIAKFKSLTNLVKTVISVLRVLFREYKLSIIILPIIIILNLLVYLIPLYILKETTELFVKNSDFITYVKIVAILFGSLVASHIIRDILRDSYLKIKFFKIGYKLQYNVYQKTFEVDCEDLENSEILDNRQKAYDSVAPNNLIDLMNYVINVLTDVLTIITMFVISLSSEISLILLVVVLTVLKMGVQVFMLKTLAKIWEQQSKFRRLIAFFENKSLTPEYAEDIRIHNKQNGLNEKFTEITEDKARWHKKSLKMFLGIEITTEFVDKSFLLLLYAYLGFRVLNGEATIDEFIFQAASVELFVTSLNAVSWNSTNLLRSGTQFNKYDEFMSMKSQFNGKDNVPISEKYSIVFKNVSYKYKNQNEYALKNINLTLDSNSLIALVGENGAGKTTLISLLLRIYKPTSGEILLNGKNIQNFSSESYKNIISVVFQNFKLFPISIKENISLSDNDTEKVHDALERVGLDKKVNELSRGIDTELYGHVEGDGTHLSGGQLQKVAIARAIYKNSEVIVLDEPTASLDPLAEYDVYTKVLDAVKGKLGIFITHRFASTRFCDRILVLKNGELIEDGTHDDLYSGDTLYKELYVLQSQYYEE